MCRYLLLWSEQAECIKHAPLHLKGAFTNGTQGAQCCRLAYMDRKHRMCSGGNSKQQVHRREGDVDIRQLITQPLVGLVTLAAPGWKVDAEPPV